MLANLVLHVLSNAVMVGDAGKITTLTVLLTPHIPLPAVFAEVEPHATVLTYRAETVWQPGVDVLGDAV